ncbi:MAG: hypothetical protein AB7F99_18270, partial [Vicinamibacterales bacterium]
MLFRTACMTASVAALALPALADNPRPAMQPLGGATKIEPLQARAYTIIDGRMVWTSDWVDLNGSTTRSSFVAAWDSIELDLIGGVIGAPTDDTPGCQWRVPAGNRWYGGATYNNPFVSNDLTTDVAGQGQQCEAVGFAWFWNVGTAEPDNDGNGIPDSQCIIAVQTFEDMNVSLAEVATCEGTADQWDDGSNFLDGVVYNFGFLPAGNGYYYSAP